MKFLAIVLTCVIAAIGYGIIHDQITARICVEYFTIGHPPIFGTDDPTWLGLGWGIVATWHVGLGVLLAIAARGGQRPKREIGSLMRPIGVLLLTMTIGATAAGFLGWQLADHGTVRLIGSLRHRVPDDRQVAFIADLWAHLASYAMGFVGGAILIIRVWRSRREPPANPGNFAP